LPALIQAFLRNSLLKDETLWGTARPLPDSAMTSNPELQRSTAV
jgi:hypothetical protein